MFGKKSSIIKVMHYEGLNDFIQDYPCTIEMKDDIFEIKRIKPETIVTLSKEQIKKIEMMEESKFMLKYHNDNTTTDKGIKKYYLVVTYMSKEKEEKYIAFWGTSIESSKFLKLQNMELKENIPNSYSL